MSLNLVIIMTRKEAMKILDLENGYTDEELRINYKKAMRRWHPDICKEENAEEMAKKINEAKYVLENKCESLDFYDNLSCEELKSKTVSDLIEKYLNNINTDDLGNYDVITKKVILDVIFKIKAFNSYIDRCNNNLFIKNAYDLFDKQIKTIIRKYIIKYCTFHNIDYNYNSSYDLIVNKEVIDAEEGIFKVYEILVNEKEENDVFDTIENTTTEFVNKVKVKSKNTYTKTKDVINNLKNKFSR